MPEITAFGAICGLFAAIALIACRIAPAYGLIAGAFIGGIIGGCEPTSTVKIMLEGAKSIIPATMRIITSGILVGILIESGAASRIAQTIIKWFGQKNALPALAVAAMFLTASGVLIDVAVITVSPIALAVARSTKCSIFTVLLAMIGGGKAGNLISPNPNTISASEIFKVDLTSLMAANLLPALCGLITTIAVTKFLHYRELETSKMRAALVPAVNESAAAVNETEGEQNLPPFYAAVTAPLVAVLLLSLRPLSKFFNLHLPDFDPMIALPLGGIAGLFVMGKIRFFNSFAASGLQRMTGVAVLLLGTGTLAGIIRASSLSGVFADFLNICGLPAVMLAPVSGIFMSAATASTIAGTTVASEAFSSSLLQSGISAIAAAAMIHAGATVLDHLPHGSFFHATAGSVGMKFNERLMMIPFESAIALVMTAVSTLLHWTF